MSEPSEGVRVSGGAAPVSLFTADVVDMISPDASLADVVTELVNDEVGLLVVGTEERVEAVISERDVVRAVGAGRDLAATSVMEVASRNIVWCDLTATVAEVAELMMEAYVRHVLVEDKGQLVGIVSAHDLLGAYAATTAE